MLEFFAWCAVGLITFGLVKTIDIFLYGYAFECDGLEFVGFVLFWPPVLVAVGGVALTALLLWLLPIRKDIRNGNY